MPSDAFIGMITEELKPFPSLPEDIERLLLETLVEIEPSKAIELVLLSKQTKEWIDPLLFRTVVLENEDVIWMFARLLMSSTRSAAYLENCTKTLFIGGFAHSDGSINDMAFIISCCIAMSRLILSIPDIAPQILVRLIQSIRSDHLRRFWFGSDTPNVLNTIASSSFYRHLTHLKLSITGASVSDWKPLTDLIELKYLYLQVATYYTGIGSLFRLHDSIIVYLPDKLRILVLSPSVFPYNILTYDWVINKSDRRVVLLDTSLQTMHRRRANWESFLLSREWKTWFMQDWCSHRVYEPDDAWELAEEILNRRLKMKHYWQTLDQRKLC